MIRTSEEKLVQTKTNHLGGEGTIIIRSLLNDPDELYGKGRIFAHTTILPGAGIGYHVHNGESETYYIYSGEGEFNDNGALRHVSAGDVTFTGDGEGHCLRNTGTEPLEFIALILYH